LLIHFHSTYPFVVWYPLFYLAILSRMYVNAQNTEECNPFHHFCFPSFILFCILNEKQPTGRPFSRFLICKTTYCVYVAPVVNGPEFTLCCLLWNFSLSRQINLLLHGKLKNKAINIYVRLFVFRFRRDIFF